MKAPAEGASLGITAIGAALLAVLIWGGTPIATKAAVAELPPSLVAALRTILSGIVLLPLACRAVLRSRGGAGLREGLGGALLSGLLGAVAFPLLLALGLARTNAAHAGIILATQPILTGAVAAVFERRVPAWPWFIGGGIAFIGAATLVAGRFDAGEGGASLAGDLLVFLAGFSACASYVVGARAARVLGSWSVTALGLAFGSLVLLPFLFWQGRELAWQGVSLEAWIWVLYLAFGASVLAYALWFRALAAASAAGAMGRVGLFQFIQPVATLIFAALLLRETIGWPLIISGAVILLGLAISRLPPELGRAGVRSD